MIDKKFIFSILFTFAVSFLSAHKIVHVSTLGKDTWNGTLQKPFKTIERALEESSDNSDTLYIYVSSGDYYMDRTININKQLSCPIVIRGDKNNKPRFIGGYKIGKWEKCGENIFRSFIPEVKLYGFEFEQFYVNGKRAVWARTPNKDWGIVEGSEEEVLEKGERRANYASQKIKLSSSDLSSLQGLSNEEYSEIHIRFYHNWDITQKKVSYTNIDSGFVYVEGLGMKPWNPIKKGSRYILYGYRTALDAPGEWYLDKKEGYVYYIPRNGEDMESVECIAPTVSRWLSINGQKDYPVKNLFFENVSFQYSSYRMPENGNEPMQAASQIEAAIQLNHVNNVVFRNCDMMHTGGYALWLKSACFNNLIDHCYIADLGAGGIKIGDPVFPDDSLLISRFNTVNNCIITQAGYELPCGVGVAIFHSSDNVITHNDIFDLKYSGVSVGWVWGYNYRNTGSNKIASPAVRNLVSYNHIHHIGWGELSDMGAVYTLGESYGTRIVNNVIHDVLSYDYGGWGLYTDEGSTGVEMSSNLVYRCKSGGFHQHYGKNNRIENNIFAFGHYYQIQFTRPEEHTSFHFRHNIILQDKGETLGGQWEKANVDMDYNLYWHLNGELKFGERSFNEWKKFKGEKHSVNINPMFKNPYDDNFEFISLKSVSKIKFKPFDISKVGVYGSDEWKRKAEMSVELINEFKTLSKIRVKK